MKSNERGNFIPKGKANKRYTSEFKIMMVETMHKEKLSHKETERRFELPHNRAANWERTYLEEGKEGLCIERRGRKSTSRPPKLGKKVEKDLMYPPNNQPPTKREGCDF